MAQKFEARQSSTIGAGMDYQDIMAGRRCGAEAEFLD